MECGYFKSSVNLVYNVYKDCKDGPKFYCWELVTNHYDWGDLINSSKDFIVNLWVMDIVSGSYLKYRNVERAFKERK